MTDIDISTLRANIDAIDDKIIALLNDRSGFVKQVGMSKMKRQQQGTAFIRSGREATLIRCIYEKMLAGVFPAEAATHIWRQIICASLSLESPLTITAFAPDEKQDAYWLAREYFGAFTPVSRQPTAKRVLGEVVDNKAGVGVLPLPDDSPEGSWWQVLPADIKIFACVPFVVAANGAHKETDIKALAVARLTPEETGNDVSILRLETDMDVSQSRLKTFFDDHHLTVRWLATQNSSSGGREHLIEINGFITQNHEQLLVLKQEISGLLAISSLGTYAQPIVL